MTAASIADLAVLGIASEGPIEPDKIATIAKALAPEHWQPTADVISAVVERNLKEDLLRRTGNHVYDEHVTVTAKGVDAIRTLLLCPPEDLASLAFPAAEAIQFCFLDSADARTAKMVLERFQSKLKKRLTSNAQRNGRSPHKGRYKNFWINMEQRRLESMVQFLAIVSNETDAADSGNHSVTETTL